MFHFAPTLKNMARMNDNLETGYNGAGTKKWFIDTYFDGLDNLMFDWGKLPKGVNPISRGDDYNIMITVENPTELWGKDYKTMKWMASDIMWKALAPYATMEEDQVSFWFITNTRTRWVNGTPVVQFYLELDLLVSYSHIVESLHGQFYFKRRHFDRWKKDFLLDINGVATQNQAFVPNFQDSPMLMNCNSFCKTKTQKFHTQVDLPPTVNEATETVALIYYSTPLDKDITIKNFLQATSIYYGENNNIVIPFGICLVRTPFEVDSDQGDYHLSNAISWLQGKGENPNDITINNVGLNKVKVGDTFKSNWEQWAYPYVFSPKVVSATLDLGGFIGTIHEDFVHEQIFYEDDNEFFTTQLLNLVGDAIDPNAEPHLGTANHRELKIAVSEKTPQTIDLALLFRAGNPLRVNNGKLVLPSNWWNVFDPEYGGKIGYIENTATDLASAIYTSRNFLDFTGTTNIPFSTSSYVEQMQTRMNQKQASYDNINMTKDTGDYVNEQQRNQDIVHTTATAMRGAGEMAGTVGLNSIFNPGKSAQAAADAYANIMEATSATITNNNIRTANTKLQYETSKNTTDAVYADLANSPSNVHTTGKITSLSMLIKNIIAKNENNIFQTHWFKNEIIETERYQIAYDMNKYGYTCDWMSNVANITDFLTRTKWNYFEIINMKERLKTIDIDPNIIEALDNAFRTGVIIWNLNGREDILDLDYNQNNYENGLLDDSTLDAQFDYIFIS